jgi:16S rRNA C967 or C1407 C5-methylase (RsmB/RsmF family)
MIRWKCLIDALSPSDRLVCFRSIDWTSVQEDRTIPEFARLGASEFLFERFLSAFGPEKGRTLCRVLNETAPTTVRANLLKTTREELMRLWKEKYSLSPCQRAPNGIHFHKREPLFSLPEFKSGLFELQDEGSQLVAGLVEAGPDNLVLDFCSGSGGKTLAFAPPMRGKGQIYLHDIRASALAEARKRLRRAGIQNAQFLPPGHPQLLRLKSKCDWVLVDAPCSGTGTLRRNPDQKWKIDASLVDTFVRQQREIFAVAVSYVKPGGRIVYATCSVLPEENDSQTAYFIERHPISLEKEPLALLPESGGPDGFYAAVFRKKNI